MPIPFAASSRRALAVYSLSALRMNSTTGDRMHKSTPYAMAFAVPALTARNAPASSIDTRRIGGTSLDGPICPVSSISSFSR